MNPCKIHRIHVPEAMILRTLHNAYVPEVTDACKSYHIRVPETKALENYTRLCSRCNKPMNIT
eukprot:2819968-Pyramimonas_sp.AAC.1